MDRLESILQTMKLKSAEIQSSKLFGVWNEVASRTFGRILDSLSSDVENKIMMLLEPVREDSLQTVNPMLERLLSQIDTITTSICHEVGIYELVSYFLRDLGLADSIHYLICVGPSLSTLFFIDWCKSVFDWPELFPTTQSYLNTYASSENSFDFPIIFIPSVVIEDRRYWSAIGHEFGHIIEKRGELVESIHEAVPIEECDTPKGRNFFHSREYVSDFIANGYFGPIYYEVAYVLLHVFEIRLNETHPPYDARLYMMQKELRDVNAGKRRVKDPSTEYGEIPQIKRILGKARKLLTDTKPSAYYDSKIMQKDMGLAVASLKKVLPYIGSPRALLNGYWEHRSEVLAALKSKKLKDPANVANKLVADSIRLTNMKRTFDTMSSRVK